MPRTTRRRAAPPSRAVATPEISSASAPAADALPRDRRLTLGYGFYDHRHDGFWVGSRRFPVLRLAGVWLERAGFAPGQRVQVRVDAGRLVIEPEA